MEIAVTGASTEEEKIYIATKDSSNDWSTETNEKNTKGEVSLNKDARLTFTPDDEWAKSEYSLSVKTYNKLNKPGDFSNKEVVNVNADKPAEPKIELASVDQTGKRIDTNNTKITKNPNPSFAISGINLDKDNIDEKAVTITISKDGESKISGAKVTSANGSFIYNSANLKDTYGDGEYKATVMVTNKTGIPSDSQEFTFEIDTAAPNAPVIDWISDSFVTIKKLTDNNVLKTVAKKAEDLVFDVTTDQEIEDSRYITATLNQNVLLPKPVKQEGKEEGKNVWRFISTAPLSKGRNGLSVEIADNYPSEEALYQIDEATTDKNDTRLPLKFSPPLTNGIDQPIQTLRNSKSTRLNPKKKISTLIWWKNQDRSPTKPN